VTISIFSRLISFFRTGDVGRHTKYNLFNFSERKDVKKKILPMKNSHLSLNGPSLVTIKAASVGTGTSTQPQSFLPAPVLPAEYSWAMVAQSLWEWTTNDWSNLRPNHEREPRPNSAWMARDWKQGCSET
ncbi:hypothetical protein BTE48_17720, partial [Oceanospirillum multiglobuliferum]